jgi:hypothetical protein
MPNAAIDLNKALHRRFALRDIYLSKANDAATRGDNANADRLREIALGLLPREQDSASNE